MGRVPRIPAKSVREIDAHKETFGRQKRSHWKQWKAKQVYDIGG